MHTSNNLLLHLMLCSILGTTYSTAKTSHQALLLSLSEACFVAKRLKMRKVLSLKNFWEIL